MQKVLGFIILVDLAFFVGCLKMPRSGLESLGAVYILVPLAGLHLLIGTVAGCIELRKRRWKFPVYFVLSTCLMIPMWYLWSELRPTYKPLHHALAIEIRMLARRLVAYKDQKILDARKSKERLRNADHAGLCRALEYPVNIDSLSHALDSKPELSLPCALIRGREALPLVALMGESYEKWARDKAAEKEVRLDDIRTAIGMLLKAGADPNTHDDKGDTPLHWALWYNDKRLVSLLIANGACVYLQNNEGRTVMQSSSYSGIGRIVQEAAEDPQMTLNCPEIFQRTDAVTTKEPAEDDQQLWSEGLLRAVKTGDIDKLTSRLAKGADPNKRDSQGQSPLHLAATCRREAPAMIEILFRAGADVDSRDLKGNTSLIAAARNHCPDIVAILLNKGADATLAARDGTTALHWTARWQADKLELILGGLLGAGALIDARDRSGRTPLMMTVFSPNTGDYVVPLLLSRGANPDAADYQGNTLMHLLASDSARKERVASVSSLIKNAVNLELKNEEQMTPLMLAVAGRKIEITKLLVEAGASPNGYSRRGTPLLHSVISCQQEKLALLNLLIGAGGNVNLPDTRGQTALHRALLNHLHVECNAPLERLLRAGANPNVHDQNGTAPLHNLAYWKRKDIAEALALLQQCGADIDIRDQQGLTTLLRAARFGTCPLVLEKLLEAGADPTATDLRGNTLLHCIAMNTNDSSLDSIQVALKAFKGLNSHNQSAQTALALARKYGNNIVAQALIKAGAETK